MAVSNEMRETFIVTDTVAMEVSFFHYETSPGCPRSCFGLAGQRSTAESALRRPLKSFPPVLPAGTAVSHLQKGGKHAGAVLVREGADL